MNWAEVARDSMSWAELSAAGVNWVELRMDCLHCAKVS